MAVIQFLIHGCLRMEGIPSQILGLRSEIVAAEGKMVRIFPFSRVSIEVREPIHSGYALDLNDQSLNLVGRHRTRTVDIHYSSLTFHLSCFLILLSLRFGCLGIHSPTYGCIGYANF